MTRVRALSFVVASLMAIQASLGVLLPQQYRDVEWIRATWFGNDWVTLLIVVPLLFTVIAWPRAGGESARVRILWCGVLTYGVYNYAFYLLGAALNVFFLIYVLLVLSSAVTLARLVQQTDVTGLAATLRATAPVRVIGGYFMAIALMLGSLWLVMWAGYAFAGKPTPVEPDAFRLVAALDLTLLVPALTAGGWLLWTRRPWGVLAAGAAGVQATLYLFVLGVNSAIAVQRGLVAPPGEIPIWGTLVVFTAAATAWLLGSVDRRVHREGVQW